MEIILKYSFWYVLIFPYFRSDDETLTCARCRPFDEGSSGKDRLEMNGQNQVFSTPSDTNHAGGKVREVFAESTKLGKRRNCCPFCEKLVTNLSRHLQLCHPDEEKVREYSQILDEDPQVKKAKRARFTNQLKNAGNRLHNAKLIQNNFQTELLPVKRSNNGKSTVNISTHVYCKHCFGLFKKVNLYKHINICPKYETIANSQTADVCHKNSVLRYHSDMGIHYTPDATDALKEKVYPSMKKDEISMIAQSDPLIAKFGSKFFNTHRESSQIKYVSSKLRNLGNLVLFMRELKPDINSLLDCINPTNFDTLVEAVRRMCSYNVNTGECKTPSAAPRVCSALKRCADIVISDAIKNPDLTESEKKNIISLVHDFSHLMKKEWAAEVSSHCEKSRRKSKVSKEDVLPDPDDIRTFCAFLIDKSITALKRIQTIKNAKHYEKLAKILIAYIITLNRRRPGEVVQITLDNYKTLDVNKDYGLLEQTALTDEEKKTSKDLLIFYIAANKNKKKVPVLLTKQMKEGIDTLLHCREDLGIKNNLLFGRPGTSDSFDGTVVLRELREKVTLQKPHHFTATGLRHHAASSSQLHVRDDTYTKRLSKFMGHDLRTHEDYYEMPLPLVQKAIVGNQLIGMTMPQSGYKNKEYTTNDKTVRFQENTSDKNIVTSTASNIVSTLDCDSESESTDAGRKNYYESPPKKLCKRVRWSSAEKETIYSRFGQYFIMKTKPERKEIKKVWEEEDSLQNRTLQQVVTYVNNIANEKQVIPSPIRLKIRNAYLQC